MKENVLSNDVEQSDWVEEYEWVGIVYPKDAKSNVAFITPLAYYDPNEGWQAITADQRSQFFPNNGKVTRFIGELSEQKVNQLYLFRPVPVHDRQSALSDGTDSTSPRHSHYLARGEAARSLKPPLPAQIFDWSSWTNNPAELPDRLEQGIPVEACLGHTIFIHYQDWLYGPLHLEVDAGNAEFLKPREYRQGTSSGGPPLLLNRYAFSEDCIITLEDWQFVNQYALDSPEDQVDWSLPQVTIKRVLKASKDVSEEWEGQERLVDRRINELAALSSSSGPQSLPIELCAIQRAQYIIRYQLERLGDLQALLEELTPDHPLFQKARELEIQQRAAEIEREVARRCNVEEQQLQEIQKAAQSAQERLDILSAEIDQARQKQAQMHTEFETLERFMRERLAELRQEPLRLLAELQQTTVLPSTLFSFSSSGSSLELQAKGAVPGRSQDICFTESTAQSITSVHGSPWQTATRRYKVKRICAALLAGLVPVADKPAARLVLETVAQMLAGGRAWTVAVPLTALSPLDLFGHSITDQRTFIPANNLADIVLEAREHPDQLGMIVLEGVDRAPFLPVIAPLLQNYRVCRQKQQSGEETSSTQDFLHLFHPRALLPDDPYQALSRLAWPANLLLGMTLDQDMSSFPLSEAYDTCFFHITADIWREAYKPGGERKLWQVPTENWYTWEHKIYKRLVNQQSLDLYDEELEARQPLFDQAMEYLGVEEDEGYDL